ncbi:MAG TPA: hypothetical protein VGO11_13255, partial [Chthoniobacteraceae bacterium]|nr:hypothetical protein [Chthoniobacteraceae bacterium]
TVAKTKATKEAEVEGHKKTRLSVPIHRSDQHYGFPRRRLSEFKSGVRVCAPILEMQSGEIHQDSLSLVKNRLMIESISSGNPKRRPDPEYSFISSHKSLSNSISTE